MDIYAQGSKTILGRILKVRNLKDLHKFSIEFVLDAINTNITLPKVF